MPRFSPNGQKIAYKNTSGGQADIYIMNIDGSNQFNVTNTSNWYEEYPFWSPDGTKIAYSFNHRIYSMDADGSEHTQRPLSKTAALVAKPSWSPDGTKIAFDSNMGGPCREIYVMNVDGSGRTRLTYECSSGGALSWSFAPSWSPNGAGIVFTSTRDDMNLIYVMNADGSGQTNISIGAECCGWKEDGPSWGQ